MPPRRLQPKVPRDLETITLRCLHKDAKKRYGSAQELAEDLRRFQAGEPIRARPIGAGERLVKWIRRRPAEAVLLALIVLVTALGVGLVTWKWREAEANAAKEAQARRAAEESEKIARQERAEAEQQREKLRQVVDNLRQQSDVWAGMCLQRDTKHAPQELLLKRVPQQYLLEIFYRVGLMLYQPVLSLEGDPPNVLAKRAQSYMDLLRATAALCRTKDTAILLYQDALKEFDKLAQKHPTVHVYQDCRAQIQDDLAVLQDGQCRGQ